MSFQPGAFQSGAFQGAEANPSGALDAAFLPSFAAAITGAVLVAVSLAGTFSPAFTASAAGETHVEGAVAGVYAPVFSAAFTGDSQGTIIAIPRDVTGGIAYLVEIDALDPADQSVTLRYGSIGFNTLPTDDVPNAHYEERVKVPGDYSRSMFSDGTTSGDIDVGAGVIELINADGALDTLKDHAFDGRTLRILTVERQKPRYSEAVVVFEGTVEQVELTWIKATVRLRDRLAELDKAIQTTQFAGTTISGGMNEAEGGPDDIKGQPKPLTFGAPKNVQAVESNPFDHIYDVGQNGLAAVAAVRDRGVALTYTGNDYTTVAALRSATIAPGRYSTARNLGLIRTAAAPAGELTIDPVEGASRTAAAVASRILQRAGQIAGEDFLPSDIAALDALNSAEVGYWVGTSETTFLQVAGDILNSIGAALVPDRLGVFRMFRLDDPAGKLPVLTLTKPEIIENSTRGVERLVTGDQGKGIPAWQVTLNYAYNYLTMRKADVDQVNATAAYKAFAEKEWRTAIAKNGAVKDRHKLATELTFDTYLLNEADAQAEATRRLALHSVARDRFRVPVKSFLVEQVDIGSIVALQMPRFGLATGKNFVVIGIAENFQTGITTLDLWG
jgi:hypothetical protein